VKKKNSDLIQGWGQNFSFSLKSILLTDLTIATEHEIEDEEIKSLTQNSYQRK